MKKLLRYSLLVFTLFGITLLTAQSKFINPFFAQYNFSNVGEAVDIPSVKIIHYKQLNIEGNTLLTYKASPNVTHVEYFFEKDPGFGKGQKEKVNKVKDEKNTYVIELLPINGSKCEPDKSKLYIRVKNKEGKWSLYDYELNIIIPDTAPPTINSITPPKTVQLNDEGEAFLTLENIKYDVTDNCSEVTPIFMPIKYDCSQLGEQTVSIAFTDENENITEDYTFKVKVEDNIAPIIDPMAIVVTLDDNGKATPNAKEFFEIACSDNCEIVKYELNPKTFTCEDWGVKDDVILTVTDSSNNSTTLSTQVVVETKDGDDKPVATVKNITVELGEDGVAKIEPADINTSKSGVCPFKASINKNIFTCDDIGKENKVELTLSNGTLSDTATAIVTVVDKSAPEFELKDNLIFELDQSGNTTIKVDDIIKGTPTDNCKTVTVSFLKNGTSSIDMSYKCSDVGKQPIVIRGTDNNENVTKKNAELTIIDNIKPTVITQNIEVELASNGEVTITPEQINNGSSDNCGIEKIELNKTKFDCNNLGDNTVELTVTDNSGNTETKTATVKVTGEGGADTPKAKAKNITVELDEKGEVTITADQVNDSGALFCNFTPSIDVSKFTCTDIGEQSVKLTLSDGNLSDSDTAIVTVIDKLAPELEETTEPVTLELDDKGEATLNSNTLNLKAKDNCSQNVTIKAEDKIFKCSDIGIVEYPITLSDDSGNTKTTTINITVTDKKSPNVIVQNIEVELDNNGEITITPEQINNGSTDNCGIEKIELSKTKFDCNNLGDNTVELTVTDSSGNTETKTATVKVTGEGGSDTPVAKAKNITKALGADGTVTITASDINDSGASFCNFTPSIDIDKFTCENIGTENTVTLTLSNGTLSDSDTAIVTIIDDEAPKVTAKEAIVLPINADGNVIITVDDLVESSSDNCKVKSITTDKTTIKCSDVENGEATITVIAEDVNTNTSKTEVKVKVEDNVNPVAKAKSIIISLDNSGSKTITAEDVNDGSSDNCGIAKMTLDKTTFTCENVGKEEKVVLTVTDFNGNEHTANATVTIEGTADPIADAKDITLELDKDGNATITPEQIDNNNATRCATNVTLSKSKFTCADLGDENEVTLTITGSTSTSSDTAIVTIVDKINPVASPVPTYTISITAGGKAVLDPAVLVGKSSDNCGIVKHDASIKTFTCDNVGENNINYTVYDASGNTHSAPVKIIVKDDSDVNIVTKNITKKLDSRGVVEITPSDIDDGSTYGCAISNLKLSKSEFDCTNIGDNEVTLSASNDATNSKKAIVTIIDDIPPTVITKNITVQLDEEGVAIVDPLDVDNGSFDNCLIANLSLDKSSFACADIGPNTVKLTATDHSNNTTSLEAVITIESAGGIPDVKPKTNIEVKLDENGEGSIIPEEVFEGSNAVACSYTVELSKDTFDCSDLGKNNITVKLTGQNGNSKSGTATITVKDTRKPKANAKKDLIINLEGKESVSIRPEDLDNGSEDNCGIEVMEINKDTFDKVKSYSVILKVIDADGNFDVAPAIVTVIDQDLTNDVLIYPNPVKDYVSILSDKELKKLVIYSSLGQQVFETSDVSTTTDINISQLSKGLYFIKCINKDDKEIIKKIIKQ